MGNYLGSGAIYLVNARGWAKISRQKTSTAEIIFFSLFTHTGFAGRGRIENVNLSAIPVWVGAAK